MRQLIVGERLRPRVASAGRGATSRRRSPTLGTDGFGRSDTRAALRAFFEVDRHHIALAALTALKDRGALAASICVDAMRRYAIEPDTVPSWLA